MADAFGSRWVSQYGDEPTPVWVAAMDHLSDDQVRHGIDRATHVGHDWPPALPVLVSYCRAVPPQCHRPFPPLPRPAQDKTAGAEWIARIRADMRRALEEAPPDEAD